METIKVKADVYWASLNKVNAMNGKYQVELCNLSDSAVKSLEELGLKAKNNPNKPEKGFYIVAKSNYPIFVTDPKGNPIEASVGNGSKAIAVVGSYPWQFKNQKGLSPSLKKLIVTDLVEYNPETDEEVSVDDAL